MGLKETISFGVDGPNPPRGRTRNVIHKSGQFRCRRYGHYEEYCLLFYLPMLS